MLLNFRKYQETARQEAKFWNCSNQYYNTIFLYSMYKQIIIKQ